MPAVITGEALNKPQFEWLTKPKIVDGNPYFEIFEPLTRLYGDYYHHFFIIGARGCGKTFNIIDNYLAQFFKNGNPFYWLRLAQNATIKMLQNNGAALFDAKLRHKYNLDGRFETNERSGSIQYIADPKKKKYIHMGDVLDVKTFYKTKGTAKYDPYLLKNHPDWYYNIIVDEMNLEDSERHDFDVPYCLANQLENILRNTKERCRIFYLGNLISEMSDLLGLFYRGRPDKVGLYFIEDKKALICVLPNPNDTITTGDNHNHNPEVLAPYKKTYSTFTNHLEDSDMDRRLLIKREMVKRPNYIIMFSNMSERWYVVWDRHIITRYSGQISRVSPNHRFIMRRGLKHGIYLADRVKIIIDRFDYREYRFFDLATLELFRNEITRINKDSVV